MKKVLITGENSYIGESFVSYMSKFEEYEINVVSTLENRWKKYDFSKYDAILHVAGIAHSDSGKLDDEKKKLYYDINTNLAFDVATKAKNEGIKQFIYMSSMIIFGDSAPMGKEKNITQSTKPSPKNAYGDSKLQAEIKINQLQDHGFNTVMIRPPMVYGSNSKGNYPLLSKLAKKLPVFPKVKNQRSMIHIDNLCELIRLIIKNNDSGIFMPQNKEYVNTSEMVKEIASRYNKKILLTNLFNIPLKMISYFIPMINKAFGNLTYDKSLSEYKEEYCVKNFKDSIH